MNLTKEDKIRRGYLAVEFLSSQFYKEFLYPELENKIYKFESIRRINEEDLEKSFTYNKAMVEAFRGLIRKINDWTTYKED